MIRFIPTQGHSFKTEVAVSANTQKYHQRVRQNEETGMYSKLKNKIKPQKKTFTKCVEVIYLTEFKVMVIHSLNLGEE